MVNKSEPKRAVTRRSCIKFHHIFKDLSKDEKQKLFELYFYYHKLAVCYKLEIQEFEKTCTTCKYGKY